MIHEGTIAITHLGYGQYVEQVWLRGQWFARRTFWRSGMTEEKRTPEASRRNAIPCTCGDRYTEWKGHHESCAYEQELRRAAEQRPAEASPTCTSRDHGDGYMLLRQHCLHCTPRPASATPTVDSLEMARRWAATPIEGYTTDPKHSVHDTVWIASLALLLDEARRLPSESVDDEAQPSDQHWCTEHDEYAPCEQCPASATSVDEHESVDDVVARHWGVHEPGHQRRLVDEMERLVRRRESQSLADGYDRGRRATDSSGLAGGNDAIGVLLRTMVSGVSTPDPEGFIARNRLRLEALRRETIEACRNVVRSMTCHSPDERALRENILDHMTAGATAMRATLKGGVGA